MVENEEGFLRESRRDWEKLGGMGAARAEMGAVGCEPHGQNGQRWEQLDSLRLTYSAIADNPEGGLAGKWRLKVGGLRIKNNFY